MNDPDCFRVAPNAHGERATYATASFPAGAVVYSVRGAATPQRTRDSIEIGPGQHVEDHYALFINHSFTPNLEVRGRDLVAIRPIAAGEEVSFNYLASESEISAPFVCHHSGRPVNSNGCTRPDPERA